MSCDPIAGRTALQEVLGGPVTLRPVKGGGVNIRRRRALRRAA